MPNISLLLVIFITLYLGIRYSIFTAVLVGILKDSFSVGVFGMNIFSLVSCAYMTVILKQYVYYKGSLLSRLLLVFFICIINIMIHAMLQMMFGMIEPL